MDEAFQSWLEQAISRPGILAGAVRENAQSVTAQSRQPEFPEAKIQELIQGISETIHSLQQNRIATSYLRWNFENVLLHCATGSNGTLAVLLTPREKDDLSTAADLILEFLRLTS